MINDIEESEKQSRDLAIKLNDFTTLLNKYNFEYKVNCWGSGEGYSIIVNKCEIMFYLSGLIEFEVKGEEE